MLGKGDLIPRGAPSPVSLPARALQVAAGSYHSVVLLSTGEVVTFGNGSKNQLGRGQPPTPPKSDPSESAQSLASRELWFARPERIPNVGGGGGGLGGHFGGGRSGH